MIFLFFFNIKKTWIKKETKPAARKIRKLDDSIDSEDRRFLFAVGLTVEKESFCLQCVLVTWQK